MAISLIFLMILIVLNLNINKKQQSQIGNDGKIDVQAMVPFKHLSNFWRTLEMSLLNYEINIFLIWFEKCVLVTRDYDGREPVFAITDTKLYVPVVALSAQGNEKLLQQLKTSSKRTINWNTYQLKPTIEAQN